MKSLFSKLSVLLLAAGFAVVGCQDFAEDIRQVEEKVENIGGNVGDLNVSTDGLKAEIAALEAQHAADIKAAVEAIAKLKADLEGKIAADIDAAEAALQAAYEAADKALAAQAANDKKELEGKLADAAANAAKALEDAKAALAEAYKNADEKIEAAYKAADDKLKADLEKQLGSLKSELEKADATQKSVLEARINATERALDAAKIEINASIGALKTELSDRISTLEGNVNGINAAVDNFVKNYEATYTLADENLRKDLEDKMRVLKEELKNADESDKADLLKEIEKVQKALTEANDRLTADVAKLTGDLLTAKSELQADIVAVDSTLKAADAKLLERINANTELIDDLKLADEKLDAAIEALKNTHEYDKGELEKAIKDEADARIEAIRRLVETHDNDVKDLQDSIEVNAAAIKAEMKAREENDAKLQADIDAANKDLADAKAKLEEKDAELKKAIDKNAGDIVALQEEVVKLQGRATALEASVKALEDADIEIRAEIAQNKADIADLKAADEAIKTQIKEAIKKAEDELAAFEAKVEKTYATKDELKNAVSNLEQKISDAVTDLKSKISTLETALKDMIQANTDRIKAEETARAKADSLINVTIANTEAALKKMIAEEDQKVKDELKKEIEKNVDLLKKDLTAIKEDFIKKLDEESKLRQTLEKTVNSLGGQVKDLEATAASHNLRITALENKISDAVQTINKLTSDVADLRTDVDNLLARIQKIVYLPEYADGKATVPYATLADGTILQGRKFYMDFMVYPNDEDLILGLVTGGANFSFDVQNVTTRAAVPTLVNKSNVKMPIYKDGKCVGIKFLVSATGLHDDFYKKPNVSGEESHSVALVLDNGNDHYSTEYINLLPEHLGDLTFDIKSAKKPTADIISTKLTDAEPEQTIPYTDTEASRTSLSGHMVYFNLGTEYKNQTYSQIEGLGFDLSEVFEAKVTYDGTGVDLFTKEEVLNNETQLKNIVVKLDPSKVATTNVGKNINVVYNYTLGTETKSAGSVVSIDKQPLTFDLGTDTATWAYEFDANADAYAFNNTLPLATYNRTFAELTDDVDVAASGITLADLKGVAATSIVVKEDGTEVVTPDISITYDGAAGKEATVTYNNFAWNKTYDVTATYDLSYSTVTVKFSFNTVGRKSSPINLQIAGTTEFDLVKDINVSGATFGYTAQIPMALQMIGVLDRSDYVAANYIKDNFETTGKEPVMSTRKVFIKDANGEYTVEYISGTSTGLHFVTGDYKTLKPHIYYANFNTSKEIPTEMLYEATITTWYGQEFRILREVKINLPKYDYVHDPLWVNKAEGYYYSQVMGEYLEGITPNIKTHALSSYSADAVDMLRAFKVVDKDGNKLTAADITTAGLVPDFDIEPSYTGTKVIMSSTNVLSYNDAENYVDVTAKLYLENSNGSRVALPTSFDVDPDGEHDGEYVEYRVLKPRPIGKLEAIDHTEYILDVKKYEIPVMKYFSLMENKLNVEAEWNHSLIDAVTNDWVVGATPPATANGFEAGKSVTDIYGLTYDWSKVEIPDNIAPYVTFDPATRTLTFDNTSTVGLFANVVVKIELHIAHTWGTDDAILEITFPKNVE